MPSVAGSLSVEIPPGVTTGARLRLRGKGVPQERGRPGDQIVTIVLETPRLDALGPPGAEIRDTYEAALRELEKIEGEHPKLLPRRAAQRGDV